MVDSAAVTPPKTRKRRRDPERTREAILEVAGRLMAKDGPDGLSVSQVAQLAGVNRGTAYHHFQTREQLVKATSDWVSDKLCNAVFGERVTSERLEPQHVIENLARFCVENPEYGRVWLVRVLGMQNRTDDSFWRQYKDHFDHFTESDLAHSDIDSEVHAIVMLLGAVLWPVWMKASQQSPAERDKMTKRFTKEMLRLSVHGVIRKDRFPDLATDMLPGHL